MAFFLCMRILLSPDKMDCAPWVPLTVYWHIKQYIIRRPLTYPLS